MFLPLRRFAPLLSVMLLLSGPTSRAQICQDVPGGPFVGPGTQLGNVSSSPNCQGVFHCSEAELLGLDYNTQGGCDPEAGICPIRVSATLRLKGTSRNYAFSPQAWTTLDWSLGETPVGTCGHLGTFITQDLFLSWLQVSFSCAGGVVNVAGDYTLRARTCNLVSGCGNQSVSFSVPVTDAALLAAVCEQPPQNDCDSCELCPLGGSSGPGSRGGGGAEPGKGSGGAGGAGVNVAGGGSAITPSQGGPGALLHYYAGGVGHPGFPGSASWNVTLGRYWSHDLAERIVVDSSDTARVWLLSRTGSFRSFTNRAADPEGLYEESTPSNEYRKLYSTGSGWELRYLDGTFTMFDSDGRWQRNVDRNGNTLEGTYAGGQLVSVSFPDNRSETFTYHPSGKLATITGGRVMGSVSRAWSYTWSGEDLTRIDRPDGTAWILEYHDVRHPGWLTAMKLEGRGGGVRVVRAWEYDGQGNVIYTWRGDVSRASPSATEIWQLEYDDALRPTETTVTDPLDDATVYHLEWSDPHHARVSEIQGACPGCGFGGDTTLRYDDPAHPLLPTEVTDGNGHRSLFSYDANGQRTSRTEAVGELEQRTALWDHDASFPAFVSRLEQPGVVPAIPRVASWNYDPATGDLLSHTIEGYEETYAGGPDLSLTTTFAYDSSGSGALASNDPPGYGSDDRTTWVYDPDRGNLVPLSRSDPLIGATVFEHDAFNRRTAVIDPNGTRTETVYDDLDRVSEIRVCGVPVPTEPCDGSNDLVTLSEYTEFGDLERTILPRGNAIEYRYDPAGRLREIRRQPDRITPGERTVYTLDAAGNTTLEGLERWDGNASTWVVDSLTETGYESRCQVKKTVLGKGSPRESATEFGYDCNGNPKQLWDANHPSSGPPSTEYDYDPLDRLETVTQPWGGAGGGSLVSSYRYDAQDHLIRVTDGEGGATIYEYSDRDQLTGETSEVSGVASHRYNEHAELVESTDARDVTETREVDELDRVRAVRYADSALDVSYVYDDPAVPFSLGRLSRIVRGETRVEYAHDPFGRLQRDGALEYRYDPNGNRREIVYPGGVLATYTYDFADRPQTLDLSWPERRDAPAAILVTNAEYLASGPLRRLNLGNGLVEDRGHDARYYPERIEVRDGAQPLLSWQYAVDSVGNVHSIVDGLGPRTFGYQDYQYFLTQGDGPWGTLDWTYDRIGNRLTEDRDGSGAVSYVYLPNTASGNSAVLERVGATRFYDFGPAGHLESIDASGNLLVFETNDEGRLSGLSRSFGDAVSFAYDGRSFLSLAHRRSRTLFSDDFENGDLSCWSSALGTSRSPGSCATAGDGSLAVTYDSQGLLHHLRPTGEPTSPELFVLHFSGRPVAVLKLGEVADLEYLTTDHLGTPILLTAADGASLWSGGFEPFGRDWQEGTSSGASENGVLLRFPGQFVEPAWTDATLGASLAYNLHRWYETGTGRYTMPDPIGLAGGWHSYAYVNANPLTWTDPTGLQRGDAHIFTPAEMERTKQESCARQAFWQNYHDMREANWKRSDKYFHCKANCEAVRCGDFGFQKACELSDLREYADQLFKGDTPGAAAADQAANRFGRERARQEPDVTCPVICALYRPYGLPGKY